MPLRLAIVEDVATMKTIWTRFLAGNGHDFCFFDSNRERVDDMQAYRPDVIFSPVVTHHCPVSMLIEDIKSRPQFNDTAIVLSTSLDNQAIRGNLDVKCEYILLTKPFTPKQLESLLVGLESRKSDSIIERKPLAVVVDDSGIVRSVMKKQLESLGFDVETAEDGFAGRQLINDSLPDISLIDINMPGKSGFELAEELLATPRTAHLPIIMISGVVNRRDVRRGFDSGVIDFLPKPIDTSIFRHIVSKTLHKKQILYHGSALVLEDSPMISKVIARMFNEMDVAVNICPSIAEFRAHLSISLPDIMTLDLSLPDGSGLDLCRELRRNRLYDLLPIVVITGGGEKEIMLESLRLGANDFIEKPFTREEFTARINNHIKSKHLHDEITLKNRALQELAYYDSLTGLFNRRYFDDQLEKFMQETRLHKRDLSVLIIDLDHFKMVNDEYGHQTGDLVLKEIASIIMKQNRGAGYPCRYGGEEFCILLPDCPISRAAHIAERIRLACESIKLADGKILQTVSVGVSSSPEISIVEELVADADVALYKAKENGRNRIELFEHSASPQNA